MELRWVGAYQVVDVRLVEFQCQFVHDGGVVILVTRNKVVAQVCIVALTSCYWRFWEIGLLISTFASTRLMWILSAIYIRGNEHFRLWSCHSLILLLVNTKKNTLFILEHYYSYWPNANSQFGLQTLIFMISLLLHFLNPIRASIEAFSKSFFGYFGEAI